MKEKIAYLRGLIDGIGRTDDNTGRIIAAVTECLDAIADEVEMNSARIDNAETDIADINERIDDTDVLLDMLLDDEYEDEDEDEDWDEDFDYFKCPKCGEVVILDEEVLDNDSNPICPKCNSPIFDTDK